MVYCINFMNLSPGGWFGEFGGFCVSQYVKSALKSHFDIVKFDCEDTNIRGAEAEVHGRSSTSLATSSRSNCYPAGGHGICEPC